MDDSDKRKLENQLITMGLAGLSDQALIQQLANLVSNWPGDRNDFLQDLINQCDADKRHEMYQAIAPKLRFKALPLSTYESRIRQRASELVSQRRMRVEGQAPRPIEIRGKQYVPVAERLSTGAIATLKCKCGRTAQYLSDTPAGAMIEARKDGWVRDKVINHEVCRECAKPNAERGATVGANRTVDSCRQLKTASREAAPAIVRHMEPFIAS